MPFTPMPGDQIQIGHRAFSFVQHRVFVNPAPHAEKGARGTVYLVFGGQEAWALKVFKPAFRKPSQTTVAARLQALKDVAGLRAAGRIVIEPNDPIVATHKDLTYAQLMPWVEGVPWSNVVDTGTRKNDCYLSPAHGFHLCHRFLETMAAMEQRGLSHTDIAGGNVIVNLDTCVAELIDLEEMFGPSFPRPDRLNRGSPGYAHPGDAAQGLWNDASDRFAASIMAAEMLILTSPELCVNSDSSGGYFANDEFGSDGPRVRDARAYLAAAFPEFEGLFGRAWSSGNLRECPTLTEVAGVMRGFIRQVPRPQGSPLLPRGQQAHWAPRLLPRGPTRSTPPTSIPSPPTPTPPPPVEAVVGSWKPLGPPPPRPENPFASWDQANPIAATASPSFRAPPSPPPVPAPLVSSEDVTIPLDAHRPVNLGDVTLPAAPPVTASTPPTPLETVYFSRDGVRVSNTAITTSDMAIALHDVRSIVPGSIPPNRAPEVVVSTLGAGTMFLGMVLHSPVAALTAVVVLCATIGIALRRAHIPAVNIECVDGRVFTLDVADVSVAEEITNASHLARQAAPPPHLYNAPEPPRAGF